MPQVSQGQLVTAVVAELGRQGVTDANERQMNAVIAAADLIAAAFARGHAAAAPGSGLAAWLASDDTGLSSRYLAYVLGTAAGERAPWAGNEHPHDADDFGRCVRLLDAAPALRPHLPALAQGHGPVWAGLAAAWAELEALYREEAPGGRAPKCYRRVREIIESAQASEGEPCPQ
jgi:hypothetical protein